jgi:hypothetical protein
MADMIDAYWFGAREEGGLVYSGYGDEPGWRDGEERTVARPEDIAICAWGYHAADNWWTALRNAPGPIACRVRLEVTDRDEGKLVGPRRMLVAHVDAWRELRLAAADFAEHVLQHERAAGREPGPSSWYAIEAARKYARGEIDARTLATAQDDAYAAAHAATYAAYPRTAPSTDAPYAAYAAAYAAADAAYAAADATYAAACAAACAAADATYAAACVADERAWQSKRLDYWMNQAFARKEAPDNVPGRREVPALRGGRAGGVRARVQGGAAVRKAP